MWNALVQGAEDEDAVRGMSRDLHTLKGDARIVGFDEIHVLTHKLEELFALAAQLQFRVSEDFELVVTMAMQFVTMLLRKKTGGTSGIDLPGFVRQVDEVLRETRVMRKSKPTNPRHSIKSGESADRLSEATRKRLAIAATEAFLEYLGARTPTSRTRLRGIWQMLSQELAQLHTVEVAPLLERQLQSAKELATELGKQVAIDLVVGDLRLEGLVAEAVDLAVLHLVRNAIDHGIEAPSVRAAAGKTERGRIRIAARDGAGNVELAIEDDGGGIDLQDVHAKALERGLIDPKRTPTERELIDVLFASGFSTRSDVTEVSGRGVGLDAVKSAIVKAGGQVRVINKPGIGTTVVLVVPATMRQIRVFQFLAPGNAVNFAISARWTPTTDTAHAEDAIDPITAIQLHGNSRQTKTGLTPPARDLVLRLNWGFLEIAFKAATEPVLATAERICPTPDDYPVEVIEIDGVEALLLRPEHVVDLVGRRR